jgi:hypothetical protein
LTPEQREAVEKLIKEKSTQMFEQQLKQHEEEAGKGVPKTTPKPTIAKAGSTKPAEKVKPATGDTSVKSDKTPTAAATTIGKKPANGKPPVEDAKKEEEKQSAADKKREEAERKK